MRQFLYAVVLGALVMLIHRESFAESSASAAATEKPVKKALTPASKSVVKVLPARPVGMVAPLPKPVGLPPPKPVGMVAPLPKPVGLPPPKPVGMVAPLPKPVGLPPPKPVGMVAPVGVPPPKPVGVVAPVGLPPPTPLGKQAVGLKAPDPATSESQSGKVEITVPKFGAPPKPPAKSQSAE